MKVRAASILIVVAACSLIGAATVDLGYFGQYRLATLPWLVTTLVFHDFNPRELDLGTLILLLESYALILTLIAFILAIVLRKRFLLVIGNGFLLVSVWAVFQLIPAGETQRLSSIRLTVLGASILTVFSGAAFLVSTLGTWTFLDPFKSPEPIGRGNE